MPTFLVHLSYLILFILAFSVGTFVWDIDHLFKCNNRSLIKTITNPSEGYMELKRLDQNNCRGFFHTLNFAVILIATTLAYILHMAMDRISWQL